MFSFHFFHLKTFKEEEEAGDVKTYTHTLQICQLIVSYLSKEKLFCQDFYVQQVLRVGHSVFGDEVN